MPSPPGTSRHLQAHVVPTTQPVRDAPPGEPYSRKSRITSRVLERLGVPHLDTDAWSRYEKQFLVPAGRFLGVSIPGKLHRSFQAALGHVETAYLALVDGRAASPSAAQRTIASLPPTTTIGGLDGSTGVHDLHSWGLAIDINYLTNPYVIHEAGEREFDVRLALVYRRIARLVLGRESVLPQLGSDLVARSRGTGRERRSRATIAIFDLLAEESDAMVVFFTLMRDTAQLAAYAAEHPGRFRSAFPSVRAEASSVDFRAAQQQMMFDWTELTSAPGPDCVDGVRTVPYPTARPTAERLSGSRRPAQEAVRGPSHAPDRPFDVRGRQAPDVRSPLRGFMSLRRSLVLAFACHEGIRWGGSDLGHQSGDLMHFDFGLGREGALVIQALRQIPL